MERPGKQSRKRSSRSSLLRHPHHHAPSDGITTSSSSYFSSDDEAEDFDRRGPPLLELSPPPSLDAEGDARGPPSDLLGPSSSTGNDDDNKDHPRRPSLARLWIGRMKSAFSVQSRQKASAGPSASSSSGCFWFLSGCRLSMRWAVLVVLCLQNSLFTVLRRYSQGVLRETYSKYECLLVGEIIKILFSAWMIRSQLLASRASSSSDPSSSSLAATGAPLLAAASSSSPDEPSQSSRDEHTFRQRLLYLLRTSRKMFALAGMYGAMNILSFVALRNISAGLFTIIAQTKVFTTAVFSSLILQRSYSSAQWRALIALVLGVLLFSEPVWNSAKFGSGTGSGAAQEQMAPPGQDEQRPWLGTLAVAIEVTLSGFASIYFEKVIKIDPLQLSIWERNFQLALGSVPVYLLFILNENAGGNTQSGRGPGTGWTLLAVVVAALGAAGGLLVALSIKYGDSILKTLATTGSIVLSSVLDHVWLKGPLTPAMMIAGCQVILAICNYTFDSTPPAPAPAAGAKGAISPSTSMEAAAKDMKDPSGGHPDEEMAPLVAIRPAPVSDSATGVSKRQGSKTDPSDDD